MAQIFLWSGYNPIAWGIQYFTGSKWSHCGFIINDGKQIIDSDWGWFPWSTGVQIRDFKSYLKYPDRLKIIDLPFTEEENKRIIELAHSFVGNAYYDLPLIISFIWEWIEHDKSFSNMQQVDGAFTCSEFISYCITKVTNKSILSGRAAHSIRPHELEILDVRS